MIMQGPAPLPRGTRPATEDDINYRRRLASTLMQEGTSTAPVQHWTQALARVLQAGVGGMNAASASDMASERESFDERQSAARRLAERAAAFEDKKAWDEYTRNRPMTEAEKLELDVKRAQINKFNREGSAADFGKTGAVFQGDDGRFYSVQFAADGSRQILPLETPGAPAAPAPMATQSMPTEGAGRFAAPAMAPQAASVPLTPARGVDVVGNQMFDKATGAPIHDVGGNLAEGERQKVLGKGRGEGEIGLPKVETAFREYEVKNRNVNADIDRALSQASPWTTGFAGNLLSFVAGTPAHDLSKTLVSIQSNLGFETLQQMRDNSPTGGALGQVTEREIELLQSTWGSLAQSQSEEQFRFNLNRLKQIKEEFAILKRRAYEADVARFGAGNVPNPNGGGAASAPDPLGIRGGR